MKENARCTAIHSDHGTTVHFATLWRDPHQSIESEYYRRGTMKLN